MPRLEELRKFALIALIASVVGTLVALWNFSGTTISLVTRNHRTAWQFVPLALIDFLVTASMPVFYFALFRRYWEVRIPPRVRPMAFGGALAVALYIVVGLPQTWGTLRGAWNVLDTLNWRSGGLAIFAIAHDPRFIGFLLLALGEFSNVAVMLVLIALFRQRVEGQSESEPASRLLNSATRAACFYWDFGPHSTWSGFSRVPTCILLP